MIVSLNGAFKDEKGEIVGFDIDMWLKAAKRAEAMDVEFKAIDLVQ